MSKIEKDKIIAYQNTIYMINSDVEKIAFKIGFHSNELKNLFFFKKQTCALFITRFNPYGEMQKSEENTICNQKLFSDLKEKTKLVYNGQGADPAGEWPPEDSFLALGINLELSKELGRKYFQDAIVWIGEDAVPELVLLR
jgi:hypothetical protein